MTGLDKFLFWYTLIFAIVITGSTVSRGFSPANLTLIALFLPLTIYTILQSVKRYYLWKTQQMLKQVDVTDPDSPAGGPAQARFSLTVFLSQRHPLFVFSLILLVVACLTTVIRFLPIIRPTP